MWFLISFKVKLKADKTAKKIILITKFMNLRIPLTNATFPLIKLDIYFCNASALFYEVLKLKKELAVFNEKWNSVKRKRIFENKR